MWLIARYRPKGIRRTKQPARAHQFSNQGPRILKMFNGFQGSHRVRRAVGEVDPCCIEIDRHEFGVCWKTLIAKRVQADITTKALSNIRPKVSGPAPHIENEFT